MMTPQEREAAAYDEGYAECEKKYRTELKHLKTDSDQVKILRTEWETIIKLVQQTYLQRYEQKLDMEFQNTFMYSENPKVSVPADMDEFQEEIGRLIKMGRDFEILLKGIEEHAVLKGTWDKLLMTFKLIQP